MGTPTEGSGMGSIHKENLKMEKFLGDIGNIKTTHGENKSNIMNWVDKANLKSKYNIDTASPNPSEGGNSRYSRRDNFKFRAMHSSTGKGKGAKYKPGELETTASSYKEPTSPEDK
jgi:hypothetical protein